MTRRAAFYGLVFVVSRTLAKQWRYSSDREVVHKVHALAIEQARDRVLKTKRTHVEKFPGYACIGSKVQDAR